jgi:hypothetical protein
MNESFYYSPAVRQLYLEDEVKVIKQNYATKKYVNDVSGEGVDLTEYPTKTEVAETYATKTEIPDVSVYANKSLIYNDGDTSKGITIKRISPSDNTDETNIVIGGKITGSTGTTFNTVIGDRPEIKDYGTGDNVVKSSNNVLIANSSAYISGGVGNIVIGNNSSCSNTALNVLVGIGNQIDTKFDNSIGIGTSCQCKDLNTTNAANENGFAIAIGCMAQANYKAVGIGMQTEATAKNSVAIGHYVKTPGLNSIAIGNQAQANKENSIAIGTGAVNNEANTTLINGVTIKHTDTTITFGVGTKYYTITLT